MSPFYAARLAGHTYCNGATDRFSKLLHACVTACRLIGMSKAFTTIEAAALLECDPSRIRHWIRDARINGEPPIGEKRGRDHLLSAADIKRLKAKVRGKVGNPNFIAGHSLGNGRKKPSRKRKESVD